MRLPAAGAGGALAARLLLLLLWVSEGGTSVVSSAGSVHHLAAEDDGSVGEGADAASHAKLLRLRQQIELAHLEASIASAEAASMRSSLHRCGLGIKDDETAVAAVTQMVKKERKRVLKETDRVAGDRVKAELEVQKTKQLSEELKRANENSKRAKSTLDNIMQRTKQDLRVASDLKRKRADAIKLAKKVAATTKDALKVKEAYVVPRVLSKALLKAEKGLPEEQQSVKDAAANYQRVRQVQEMTEKVAAKHSVKAKKTVAEVEAASKQMKEDQSSVQRAEKEGRRREAALMVKKKAEVHRERELVLREDSGPSSGLLKRVKNADVRSEEALSDVKDTAKALMNAVTDHGKQRLLKKLESAKAKEHAAKANKVAMHAKLTRAKMRANLDEQKRNIDLKEEQDSVMKTVSRTENDLYKTRMIAAESTIHDAKGKLKHLQTQLAGLLQQLRAAKAQDVRSTISDSIEKVRARIRNAETEIKLSDESIRAGRTQLTMRHERTAARKEAHQARKRMKESRHKRRKFGEQLSNLRDDMAAASGPSKTTFQRVKILEARRKVEAANIDLQQQKLKMAKTNKKIAALTKQYLSVGVNTRRWEFLEQAKRNAKQASAALQMARSVSNERESKVGSLKESLDRLKHPIGEGQMAQMLKGALKRKQVAENEIQKIRKKEATKRWTLGRKLFKKQLKMVTKRESSATKKEAKLSAELDKISVQMTEAESTMKPKVKAADKKLVVQDKALASLKKKLLAAKSKPAKKLIQQELSLADKAKRLALDEKSAAQNAVKDLHPLQLKTKLEFQAISKELESIGVIKGNLHKQQAEQKQEANKLQDERKSAQDALYVARKSLGILNAKIKKASKDPNEMKKLSALVDQARAKRKTARLQYRIVRKKQNRMWAKQRKAMDITLKNIAEDKIEGAKQQISKTGAEISKLKKQLADKKVVADVPKANLGATKQIAATNKKQVAQLTGALKVQESALVEQKKVLRTHKMDLKKLMDRKLQAKSELKDTRIKMKEAKEKRTAARTQVRTIRGELKDADHPNGEHKLLKKIKSTQKDAASAKHEVGEIEAKEAKAQLVQHETEKLKQKLELKMKVLHEKQTVVQQQIKVLKASIAKEKKKDRRIQLIVQLKTAQAELKKLNADSGELIRSVDRAKVESKGEHYARVALEQEIKTFTQEKLITKKQIKRIRAKLDAPNSKVPAAQRLHLEKSLRVAKDKMTIANNKLKQTKGKMQKADRAVKKRLTYRGIAWKKDTLLAAKRTHKMASTELDQARLKTRAAREVMNKKTRLTSDIIARKQKMLASRIAALDSLRGVKDMGDSRAKLRLQIQAVKMEVKERLGELEQIKASKARVDERINLAAKKSAATWKQEQQAAKHYRRARVLKESDERVGDRIRDKINFLDFQKRVEAAKYKYKKQAKAIATAKYQLAAEPSAVKREQLQQNIKAMEGIAATLAARHKHLAAQSKYQRILTGCQSKDSALRTQLQLLISKANTFHKKLTKASRLQLKKSILDRTDKDARKASANAAARVAAFELKKRMATASLAKRGATTVAQTHVLDVKLKLAQQQLKAAQMHAAAAAQASSTEGREHVATRIRHLQRKAKQTTQRQVKVRLKLKGAEHCISKQRSMIASINKKYTLAKLHAMDSIQGNDYDAQHKSAARKIHELEKKTYAAQRGVQTLNKQKKQYQGALSELLGKLSKVTDSMEQKTLQKLVISVKAKQASAQAGLEIAMAAHTAAQRNQLKQAQAIAVGLETPSKATISTHIRGPANPAHPPSAVHAAIAQILEQPY